MNGRSGCIRPWVLIISPNLTAMISFWEDDISAEGGIIYDYT